MSKIPHGEPYAGKLHVRFDEGADVPCGGVSPYSTPSPTSRLFVCHGRWRGLDCVREKHGDLQMEFELLSG